MARTCVWCGDPLPEPEHKGHRRREFCKPPKTCKQKHHMWHKQMKHDADVLAEPYWRTAYSNLVEQYKLLELRLQERISDLEEQRRQNDTLEKSMHYYRRKYEDLQLDYVARLRALGMSEQDIEEFHAYWREQSERQSQSWGL